MLRVKPRKLPAREDEYIVDELFPAREVNFIAGASGAGKTTWLLQMLDRWKMGKDVGGYPSYPRPFAYISFDRSGDGCHRFFERLNIFSDDWVILQPQGQEHNDTLIQFLTRVTREYPEVRVLVIEALVSMVPEGKMNDYRTVKKFMVELREFCVTHNITILATMHTTKTKEGESYPDPRQKIIGSVAFAGFAEGVVFIEQPSADSPDRALRLMPRNAPERTFKMTFDEKGLLVPLMELSKQDVKVLEFAVAQSAAFTPKQVVEGTDPPMAISTVKFALKRLVNRGKLIHNSNHGTYIIDTTDITPNV